MLWNSRASQHQAKHFQPEDHEHPAHQEQVSDGRGKCLGAMSKNIRKNKPVGPAIRRTVRRRVPERANRRPAPALSG